MEIRIKFILLLCNIYFNIAFKQLHGCQFILIIVFGTKFKQKGCVYLIRVEEIELENYDIQKVNKKVLYWCNFDLDSCNGTPSPSFENNLFSVIFDILQYVQIGLSYSLSDFTSVSKPTVNKLYCQIPYFYLRQQYHCQARPSFDCITTSGSFAQCSRGRFLLASNSAQGRAFSYNFTFPMLKITNIASFDIKFKLFYMCDGVQADCRNMEESITVTINDMPYVYEFDELTNNPTWVQKTIRYNNTDEELNIKVNFKRVGSKVSLNSFLALDDLELVDDEDEPTTIHEASTASLEETSTAEKTTFYSTFTDTSTSVINNGSFFYSCNFDTNDCGGIPYPPFDTNILGVFYGIFQYVQTAQLISLSDFTSISKPTANGLFCRIPYLFNNIEHYHCQARIEFDCVTTSDQMAKCTPGRFLLAKSIATSDSFNYSFTFPKLYITTTGVFEIRFQVFYLCDGLAIECRGLNESIIVNINDTPYVYDFDQLTNNPTWVQKIIRYDATPAVEMNINIKFLRQNGQFELNSFMAFDELEIKIIDDETTVSSESSTTVDSTNLILSSFEQSTEYQTDLSSSTSLFHLTSTNNVIAPETSDNPTANSSILISSTDQTSLTSSIYINATNGISSSTATTNTETDKPTTETTKTILTISNSDSISSTSTNDYTKITDEQLVSSTLTILSTDFIHFETSASTNSASEYSSPIEITTNKPITTSKTTTNDQTKSTKNSTITDDKKKKSNLQTILLATLIPIGVILIVGIVGVIIFLHKRPNRVSIQT